MITGWVKLFREIQEHWIWQDEKYLKWWLSIILNVNYEPRSFPVGTEIHVCNPGQSFRSIDQWTDMFSCSKKTTVRFFEMLKNDEMIQCKIVGKGNRRKHLLTVVNWKKYQQMETEKDLERVPVCSVNGNPNVTPNKKEKNEKKNDMVKNSRFSPPSLLEIESYFTEKLSGKGSSMNSNIEAEKFESFYSSKNWMVGKNKMAYWKKAVSGWIARSNPIDPPEKKIELNLVKKWQ